MNTSIKTLLIGIVIIILGIFLYQSNITNTGDTTLVNTDNQIATESILGCYVATLGQDIYSLNISSQNGQMVQGSLVFDNFEKDSSSGSFVGVYQNGILLGNYSFQSEGMNSEMQVIFQKTNNGFIRGFGELDTESGTMFTDMNAISFDGGYEFIATDAACAMPGPRMNL